MDVAVSWVLPGPDAQAQLDVMALIGEMPVKGKGEGAGEGGKNLHL